MAKVRLSWAGHFDPSHGALELREAIEPRVVCVAWCLGDWFCIEKIRTTRTHKCWWTDAE